MVKLVWILLESYFYKVSTIWLLIEILLNSYYPTTSDLVMEIGMTEACSPSNHNPIPGGAPHPKTLHPEEAPHHHSPKPGGGGCVPHPITVLLILLVLQADNYDQKKEAEISLLLSPFFMY